MLSFLFILVEVFLCCSADKCINYMYIISSSNSISVAVGDFNDDNRLDIAVANHWSNTVDIFLGHWDGTFSTQVICSTGSGSGPYSIAVDDFNNDSQLDIVVANP